MGKKINLGKAKRQLVKLSCPKIILLDLGFFYIHFCKYGYYNKNNRKSK